jgi:hypothetical protein
MEQQFNNERTQFRLDKFKLQPPRALLSGHDSLDCMSVQVLDEVSQASKTFLKDRGGRFFEKTTASHNRSLSKVSSAAVLDIRSRNLP